jgi:hypothetical protein
MARNTQTSGRGGNRGNSKSSRSSGGNNSGTSSSRSRNNNPSGRNQYSSGVLDLARDRPVAAAAVAAGAAAAGLFLWSKRAQISEQLSSLSEQIGDWTDNMMSSDDSSDWSEGDDTAGLTTASGISETGSGSTSSGRGRSSQSTIG